MASTESHPGVPRGLPDGPVLDDDALWRLDEDPATVLADLERRYGDIFTIHRPEAPPRVVLTTGEHVRELAALDPELHSCGTSQFAQLVGENSVNMLSGEPHRLMRQLLLPSFHARAVGGYVPRIRRIIREEFDRLAPACPIPLTKFTGNIALRVMTSVLFSSIPEAEVQEVQDACDTLLELIDGIHQYRAVPPAHRDAESDATARTHFRERLNRLDRHLLALIATYRAHPASNPTDLLGRLVAPPAALSDREIRDQLVTMLVAGHLTTAASLAVAAYWLNRPQDHADEAADETIAELDALAADAAAADLAAARRLAAFCDEALRLGSVVPHSAARRTPRTLTAFGHRLPPGTELVVSIHLAHRRPGVFPEPEAFRPCRFVDARPSAAEFVPFGQGTRRCSGAALVTTEMKIFLAEMHRTPGLELIGADLPLRAVSLGSTLAPPAHILIQRNGTSAAVDGVGV